jgi:hypothetical protein
MACLGTTELLLLLLLLLQGFGSLCLLAAATSGAWCGTSCQVSDAGSL